VFAIENLKPGGKFICKYFAGAEDQWLKKRLEKVFKKVFREKPNASRKESREMYFIGIGKVPKVTKENVFRRQRC
jgi:21S rRNA (uridine2791-2'-O)-methyltransferase